MATSDSLLDNHDEKELTCLRITIVLIVFAVFWVGSLALAFVPFFTQTEDETWLPCMAVGLVLSHAFLCCLALYCMSFNPKNAEARARCLKAVGLTNSCI
jgi:hypothetical protein